MVRNLTGPSDKRMRRIERKEGFCNYMIFNAR